MIRHGWPYFEGYPFQERFLHLEGLEIHYVDEGYGSQTVLMVHGNPSWSYIWRRLIPPVSAENRVLALDLMGFGKSDKPYPGLHDFPHHARIVSGFIESLGLRNLILVAHDWGATFAMQYVVRHAANVSGLVLMNTFLTTDFRIPLAAAAKITPATIRDSCLHPENVSDSAMEAYWAPFPDEDAKKSYQAFARMFPDSMTHPSFKPMREIEQALPNLKTPTTIIWGTSRGGSTYAEKLAKMIPRAKLHAVNAGHFLQEDAPAEVEKLVMEGLGGTAESSAENALNPSGSNEAGWVSNES